MSSCHDLHVNCTLNLHSSIFANYIQRMYCFSTVIMVLSVVSVLKKEICIQISIFRSSLLELGIPGCQMNSRPTIGGVYHLVRT